MTQSQEVRVEQDEAAYDKTGRQIMVGDVLRVFHFRGARWRKDYYMYKQVICARVLGKSGKPYLFVSHLNMKADPVADRDGGYNLAQDGQIEDRIEIVQGLDWHHDRPRRSTPCPASTTGAGSQATEVCAAPNQGLEK